MTYRAIEDHHLLDQRTLLPAAVAEQLLQRVRLPLRMQLDSINGGRILRLSTLPCSDLEVLTTELRRIRGVAIGLAAAEGCFCCAYGAPAQLTIVSNNAAKSVDAQPLIDDVLGVFQQKPIANKELSVREAIELTRRGIPVAPVVRRTSTPGPEDERLLREVPPHH